MVILISNSSRKILKVAMKKKNAIEKVTQWVEYKVGKCLNMEVNKKVQSETSFFDVHSYCQTIFETYFSHEIELNQLKSEISNESFTTNFESDDFSLTDDGFSRDSSDGDDYGFDFEAPSLEDIIADLQSPYVETQTKGLEALEASSAEDLVLQTSWTATKKILLDMLNTSRFESIQFHALELFRRFLFSNDSPKVVCEGFISLTDSIAFHIESINHSKNEFLNEICDLKENNHWCSKQRVGNCAIVANCDKAPTEVEIIFRSMWLLIQSQKAMPLKWGRFNEKRLREIIFSFISMLASSANLQEDYHTSSIEILSILDPKATWCYHWCHGATGRTLLCSALKTHKKLFSALIDFILTTIKNKESATRQIKSHSTNSCNCHFKLPPLEISKNSKGDCLKNNAEDCKLSTTNLFSSTDKPFSSAKGPEREGRASKRNHSAPSFPMEQTRSNYKKQASPKINSHRAVCGIWKEITKEVKLCHCISAVVCLIRFRGGRSLFPLEITSRKRRMTVPNLILMITNYIEGVVYEKAEASNSLITEEYRYHMMKLLKVLKSM